MNKSNNQWRQEQGHLPPFMRDFHQQKELFRTLHNYFNNAEDCTVNWRDGHVYTIDWFLWFMAIHGYKLTKTTAKIEFKDLEETIKNFDPRNSSSLADLLPSVDEK
jgi:hypothetical protein